jgi:hypothetical protein
MREKQTGYLGIEETLSTIFIARSTMTPKKRAQRVPAEKPSEHGLDETYPQDEK